VYRPRWSEYLLTTALEQPREVYRDQELILDQEHRSRHATSVVYDQWYRSNYLSL
jgi:hypothetical protein